MLIETLTDTMKRLGHDYIDILKVDIEGDEWGVFAALIAELGSKQEGADPEDAEGGGPGLQFPFGQLLIELHYKDMPSTFDFFFGMQRWVARNIRAITSHIYRRSHFVFAVLASKSFLARRITTHVYQANFPRRWSIR
jgi:hypothetical protein